MISVSTNCVEKRVAATTMNILKIITIATTISLQLPHFTKENSNQHILDSSQSKYPKWANAAD